MNYLQAPLLFVTAILVLLCVTPQIATAQTTPKSDPLNVDLQAFIGDWTIDLRPTPDAEPYLKHFRVDRIKGTTFKGEFYETAFKNGLINTNWGKLQFAFTTKDNSGIYFHSGSFDGESLRGMTYAEDRGFVMSWFSVEKAE